MIGARTARAVPYLVWRRLRFISDLRFYSRTQSPTKAKPEAKPDTQAEPEAVDREWVERFGVSSHHGSGAIATACAMRVHVGWVECRARFVHT